MSDWRRATHFRSNQNVQHYVLHFWDRRTRRMKMAVIRHWKLTRQKLCYQFHGRQHNCLWCKLYVLLMWKQVLMAQRTQFPDFWKQMILQRHITIRMPGDWSWLKYTDCKYSLSQRALFCLCQWKKYYFWLNATGAGNDVPDTCMNNVAEFSK